MDWPTESGKTEQQVVDHCRGVLKASPVYEKCEGKFDEDSLIHDCKLDVQVMVATFISDSYC